MPKPSPKKQADSLKLEFAPDAWERFESLVKSAAKMGPLPQNAIAPRRKKAVKRRAKKPAK